MRDEASFEQRPAGPWRRALKGLVLLLLGLLFLGVGGLLYLFALEAEGATAKGFPAILGVAEAAEIGPQPAPCEPPSRYTAEELRVLQQIGGGDERGRYFALETRLANLRSLWEHYGSEVPHSFFNELETSHQLLTEVRRAFEAFQPTTACGRLQKAYYLAHLHYREGAYAKSGQELLEAFHRAWEAFTEALAASPTDILTKQSLEAILKRHEQESKKMTPHTAPADGDRQAFLPGQTPAEQRKARGEGGIVLPERGKPTPGRSPGSRPRL